jgi:[ribosomal protein S5]-alanine N-acetyltransferase
MITISPGVTLVAMIRVKTARLTLLALTPDLLETLVRGWADLEAALGINAAGIWIPDELREAMPQSFAICLEQCKTQPDDYLWHTVWPIIHNEENRVIGTIGLGGPPKERRVIIGYWIDERYRNRGYGTEAVQALAQWAFENPTVSSVTASTPEENLASQRVLQKSGFNRRGEYEGSPLWVLDRPSEPSR